MVTCRQRRRAQHALWLLSHRGGAGWSFLLSVQNLFFPRRAKTVRPKARCLFTSGSEGEQEATHVIRSHLEEHLLGNVAPPPRVWQLPCRRSKAAVAILMKMSPMYCARRFPPAPDSLLVDNERLCPFRPCLLT